MSTTIYYFTGTGNSLKVAKDLAESLGDTKLIPIAKVTEEQLNPDSDSVGIVFPVYAWGPPLIVKRFLEKISIRDNTYLFATCTCGGSAGGTLVKAKKQLASRGIKLSSGFIVLMPSNYIIWSDIFPKEKEQQRLDGEEKRIAEISSIIKQRLNQEVEMNGLIHRTLTGLLYDLMINSLPKMDKKFVCLDTCNGCALCESICPVDNIEMKDHKPIWLHHCEQCLACMHFCPKEAIQVGKKTIGRKRYHCQGIKVKELMQ